jgi:hypothetical protein
VDDADGALQAVETPGTEPQPFTSMPDDSFDVLMNRCSSIKT